MEAILAAIPNVAGAALLSAIVTQVIKKLALPPKILESQWYGLVVNVITIIAGVLFVFIFQQINWMLPGWEWLIIGSTFSVGLSIGGFELIKNVWDGIKPKQ